MFYSENSQIYQILKCCICFLYGSIFSFDELMHCAFYICQKTEAFGICGGLQIAGAATEWIQNAAKTDEHTSSGTEALSEKML